MKIKYNKWLLLIIVLACILRLIDITTESYWFDEIYSIALSKFSFPKIAALASIDVHPPFYYMIFHIWIKIFGISELAARSFSAVLSIATIPIIYILTTRLFNKKTAYIAALIFAFSRINIFYSQECRMYTLLTLLACVSYYFLILILRDEGSKRNKSFLLLWYLLANTAMIYTHNFGFMILLAQVLYILTILIRTKSLKTAKIFQLGISYVILFVLYLPWLFVFLSQLKTVGKGFWLPEISIFSGIESFIELSGSIILATIFLIIIVYGFLKKSEKESLELKSETETNTLSIGGGLFWLWFILPIAIPLLVSYIASPIFNARYLLLTSPALIILVSVNIDRIVSNNLKWAIVILILALSIIALTEDWTTSEKEDWRSAAGYLDKTVKNRNLIIVDVCPEFNYLGDSQALVEMYTKNKALNYFSIASYNTKRDLKRMLKTIKKYDNIYFVKSHGKEYHNPMDSILTSQGFTLNKSVYFENYVRRYMYYESYAPNKYDLMLKKCTVANSIKIETFISKNNKQIEN